MTEKVPSPLQHSPLPMFPVHWYRPFKRLDTLATLCGDEILLTTPSPVSSEELALPRLIRCELSRLRCNGHSLLLSSYLCRIKRKENSSCSVCGHHLQDLTRLLFDCSVSEPLRRAIFGTTSSIFGHAPTVGSPWSSSTLPSLGRGRVAPPPPKGPFTFS